MEMFKIRTTRNMSRIGWKGASAAKRTFHTSLEQCIKHLPQQPRDRIMLFMFICCLIPFTRALLGLGIEEKGLCTPHITHLEGPTPWLAELPNERASVSAANDTHTTLSWQDGVFFIENMFDVAPASIPQNVFPDPTPVQHLLPNNVVTSPTTTADTSRLSQVGVAFDYGYNVNRLLFDLFRLDLSDDEMRARPYLFQGIPSATQQTTKRGRRFGRCLFEEDCK